MPASRAEPSSGETGFAWYMGMARPIYVCWVLLSALGAAFGNFLPDTHVLGFDFCCRSISLAW
jgi:predicted branched-subunit amino acid permease